MNPNDADDMGIVAVGLPVTADRLIESYAKGIFPWPHEGYPMLWFCPPERGIIEFKNLHISKSLKKFAQKSEYTFCWDKAFDKVMELCANKKRKDQSGTWITTEMKSAYIELHKRGFAHSFECWRDCELVAGLYGVSVGGYFSAESMAGRESNSSKLTLWKAIESLEQKGLAFLDVQMITEVTGSFGGDYVTRKQFLKMIANLPALSFSK